MKIKRFFLLLFLVVSTLFVNEDKVTISASNQNEISNNSFKLSSSRNASLLLLNNNVVYASTQADKIFYVSLGDSIAVGHNLPEYDTYSTF